MSVLSYKTRKGVSVRGIPKVYFSVSYNCCLVLSYIFYLFVEDFTVFIHSTPEFGEYL